MHAVFRTNDPALIEHLVAKGFARGERPNEIVHAPGMHPELMNEVTEFNARRRRLGSSLRRSSHTSGKSAVIATPQQLLAALTDLRA